MHPTLLSTKLFGVQLDFHAYTFFLALAFLVGTLLPVRKNYQLPHPYPITPIGGLCFLAGWLCLGLAAWRLS